MTRPRDRPRPELSSVDRSTALVLPEASMDGAAFRRWKSRVNELGDDRPDRAEPADLLERSIREGDIRPSDPLWDRSKPTGSGATAATKLLFSC